MVRTRRERKVKMAQLVAGMFRNADSSGSYCIVGLGTDGCVYRYDTQCQGWFPLPMGVTERCTHRR